MLTEEQIRDELLVSLNTIIGDTGEITEDENLLTRGLESLPAMRLLAVWIKQGYRVSFGSFMRKPTVREWASMLAGAAPSSPESSSVEGRAAEPPLPSSDSEPFDLTDVQYAYWIGREPTQQFGGVGTHGYVEIETTGLDLPRLQRSWTVLLQSHPMLRSCYTDDGKQYVLPEPPDPSIEVHDLTHLRGRACEEAICITRERLSHRLLDIAKGRVACLQVSRLPEGRAIIHFDIDLLVCDVQSFQIILRDLAHHYATGEAPEVDPSWSFARHLAMHAHSDAIDHERDQAYWRGRLPELPSGPRLPLRRGGDTGGSPRFTRRSHEFDAHTWARLRDVCEHHVTTPAMVLLTAYGRTIGQWSENKEFLVAVPVFNRDSDPEIENVVADFTTLTLTSIDQSRPRRFKEDLQSIQDSFYRDLAHSRYSAVRVLRDLRVQRGEQVLAPVVFSCNLGSPLVDEEFVEAFGEIGYMISQTPQVWMDLQVFTTLGGFVIICDAVEQMFPTGMLDDFFGALVDEITSALSGNLSQEGPVDSPGALARRRARAEVLTWRLPSTTLVEQVLSAGTRHPEAVAVTTSEGVPLTYREVVTAARAIATSLAAAGVTRGDLTAVMVERGPRQIVAALGVMMAGGAYVPISRQQPRERVATMLASGRTTHLLTDAGIEEWADAPVELVDFTLASSGSDGQTLPELHPEDTAYVIYTSGTTGAPKGVEVSHGAAWNTISEVNRRIDIGPGDRVLGVSSFDFDLSVYDVFGVLSVGAELVTLPDVARRDADTWLSLVQGANITVWNSVPTLFEMLLATAAGAGEKLASLRLVILSGDWIDVGLPERMRAAVPSAHLLAMGGATEAAIWSNALEVEDVPAEWTTIPYGRALARQAYRVVGPHGRDCPNDAVGELWIGGLGVAKGYVDDPELTSEKFVSSEGSRWYRTGDMGRFWHDGTIEFLGRRDNQVKIRGHRIELGEVEAAFEAVLPVERAICVAHTEGASTSLIIFVRLSGDASSRIASHDLSRGVKRLLEDPKRRAAVDEDEALQSFYALETMRRWEDELRRRRTPEHLRGRRGQWQEWLSVTSRGTDKDFPPMALAPLNRFVTPFERAFVTSPLPPSSAEFLQDPDVLPVENFLATRPLGRLIHEVLTEAVREWHEAVGGRRQVLEIGARRLEESVRYRRAAEPGSYVLADPSRHFLDRAEEVVGDLFDFHQLGGSGTPDRCRPRAAGRADLVICNQTLHQAEDIDATLQEVWRSTTPGGLMLAVETTSMSPMADISAAFLAGEPHDLRASSGRMLLDPAEWDEAFRRNGWTPMECIPIAASSILFIAKRTAAITPQRLPAREFEHVVGLLSSRLPGHMRPKQVFEIGRLPLTGNGKVDRKSLLAMVPEELDEGTDFPELPRTSTEERLIEIWDELLRTSSSVDADYFRLGGDSLTATKLRRAIEDRFDIEFPLDGIFDAPRLRDMAERIDEASARSSKRTVLPPMIHGDDQFAPFPLTEVQQSYLIGSSGGIELGEVSSHCYFEMATPVLDPRRVEAAFNALIKRHAMLRTVVCDDALHQRVLPDVPRYVLPTFESPKLSSDPLVEEIRDEMSRQRFDPTQWPCFDIRLVSDIEGGRLFLSFDNLFVDGWSMFHLFREWKRAYEYGASSLTDPLPYSFKDYVETTTEWARSELYARDLAYWESSLETIRPAPQLPISGVEAMGSSEFVRHEALLPEDTWRKVKEHVQDHGLTEAVFLAEVYAEVLARHSEEPGLSINLTRFDRTRFAPEVDNIVGDFTSLSILSVDTDCATTFRERAAVLQRRMVSNLEHGSVTGVAVQRMLSRQRGKQMTMPVVFTCGLGVVDGTQAQETPYLGVLDHGLSQTPQVWMDLQVYEHRHGLMLNLDAVESIFPRGMVAEIFRSLTSAIEDLARDPERWQEMSPTVAPSFNEAATAQLNRTNRELPPADATLLDLCRMGAREHPDQVAVIDSTMSWTHAELDHESDWWARRVRGIASAPGELVGVLMDKSVHQIAAVIGVLKTGSAYLPLSVEHPQVRNAAIIRDAGVTVLITDRRADELGDIAQECTILSPSDVFDASLNDIDLMESSPRPDALAYVIYTSGTTGTPKGVAITHRAAVNTIMDVNERLEVGPSDRVLALSQLNFDLSVYDVFGMLSRGAAIVLPPPEGRRDPEVWRALVKTHHITLWNSVPPLFSMYLEHLSDRAQVDDSIRAALLSGDWIPVDIARRAEPWVPECTIIGLGGATETSIWSNWYAISASDAHRNSIPYGRPLANQRMYVLDSSLNNRPDLVPGDLYIAGLGLAQGYWKDAVKTAESFVTHPRTGERLYRTGDLALYGADGNIVFLGRRDGQVKVNGHRIELGEIESVTRRLPTVRDCAATIDRGIVLHVVPGDGFTDEALEAHLAGVLPAYMQPRLTTLHDALPRTWNGKIDRGSLRRSVPDVPQVAYGARDERDASILGTLQTLLDRDELGIDDDFFSVGGDSLTAVHMSNAIRRSMSVDVSIRDVFAHPTTRQLSDHIAALIGTDIDEGEI